MESSNENVATMRDMAWPGEARTVVGRYAPSPSGRLHVGNLFSFMVATIAAHQAAKATGSVCRMVLRMEDLDPDRCKSEYATQLLRDLEWFGFEWDGPVVYQSQRTEAYADAFESLSSRGLVYPCFCTRADLHAAAAPHPGEEFVYPGTCSLLSNDEIEERMRALADSGQGRRPAWRVRVPAGEGFVFIDEFQGVLTYDLAQTCGDFVIRRSDGVYAYQLAVVLDDALQSVNSVVRGVDLLSSVPRQSYLQELLNVPRVAYGHVPLFVDEAGRRLSKRNADASLSHLIEERKLPAEAILGHLAWLSGLIDEPEAVSIRELVRHADLDALNGVAEILWKEPA